MIPDKVREIIDIHSDDLPKGQRLLRESYKPISRDEMKEMLGVDCLAKEYNDNLRKEIQARYKKWVETDEYFFCGSRVFHFFLILFGYPIDGEDGVIYKKKGGVTQIRLEGYAKKMIPPRCIQEVSKAHQAGFSQFWVVEPDLASPDPLIIGSFEESDQYWFITRWE